MSNRNLDAWCGHDPCHTCNLTSVFWQEAKRGKFLVHVGGKKSCRFPCKDTACGHIDCQDARRAQR